METMGRVAALAPVFMPISGESSCGDSLQALVKDQATVMADFVAFVLGGGDPDSVDDTKALEMLATCACVAAPAMCRVCHTTGITSACGWRLAAACGCDQRCTLVVVL
jgi:hypothetical protein